MSVILLENFSLLKLSNQFTLKKLLGRQKLIHPIKAIECQGLETPTHTRTHKQCAGQYGTRSSDPQGHREIDPSVVEQTLPDHSPERHIAVPSPINAKT